MIHIGATAPRPALTPALNLAACAAVATDAAQVRPNSHVTMTPNGNFQEDSSAAELGTHACIARFFIEFRA
jgi:hypothetical protein